MENNEISLASGDVIEFTHHTDRVTAEVMLVTDDGSVLLDLHDDDRMVHAKLDQLIDLAVFTPETVAA